MVIEMGLERQDFHRQRWGEVEHKEMWKQKGVFRMSRGRNVGLPRGTVEAEAGIRLALSTGE